MRLNLGCGDHYAEGWVNIDCTDAVRSDLVHDVLADRLPYPDGSVQAVYAGHFLEHVEEERLPALLAEIDRVLQPGGQAVFVGPDHERAVRLYPEDTELHETIVGGEGRWPGDQHHWLCTEATMLAHVRERWPSAVAIDIADVHEDWPVVSRIDWQCAVGVKA